MPNASSPSSSQRGRGRLASVAASLLRLASVGITYRHTLGQPISMDAGVPARSLPPNVFFAPLPPRN